MAQFVQLQENIEDFEAAGIAVVALTYDAPELQQAFIDKNGISYPFLSDINAHTVKALGILNKDYTPGDDAYGIPYPGIYIIDPELKVVGKFFVDGYQKRVESEAVLANAIALLN